MPVPHGLWCCLLALLALNAPGMSRRPPVGAAADSRAGVVTIAELDTAVVRYLRQMARITPDKVFSAEERAEMRRTTLEDLILRKIFMKMAGKDKDAAVLDSDVRERYLIVCSGIFNNSEEQFRKALAEDGWTEAGYLENLKEIIVAENMRRKVVGDIEVTPRAVKAYYDARSGEFTVEETELSHILVAMPERDAPERDLKTVRTALMEKKVPAESLDVRVREEEGRRLEKIKGLLDSARAGTDFAGLARRHSDDGSRESGGSLGVVARGAMVKPFEEAAFALRKGEISPVVKTEFGYHIIKALRDPAVRVQPLKEVETQIEGRLRSEIEAEKMNRLMKKWKVRKFIPI